MLQFPDVRRVNKLALLEPKPVRAVVIPDGMSARLVDLVEERLRLQRTIYTPAQQVDRERELSVYLVGLVQTYRRES